MGTVFCFCSFCFWARGGALLRIQPFFLPPPWQRFLIFHSLKFQNLSFKQNDKSAPCAGESRVTPLF
jgi:hypothetical protein